VNLGPYQPNSYVVGDCRSLLRALPDESINCVVTSPPYWGLRSYLADSHDSKHLELGLEKTPGDYIARMVEVFREVRRVLRDDGALFLNIGDSYCPGRRGFPEIGIKPKDLVGIPWTLAFAMRFDGWYLRQEIIWHKPNVKPESVKDRPTRDHEQLFLLSKSPTYNYDYKAIAEPAVAGARGSLFCEGKTAVHQLGRSSKRPRNSKNTSHVPGTSDHSGLHREGQEREPEMRNKRTVWRINTEPSSDEHYACMPRKLVEPCILAGCQAGGVVLDPFAGSGTTGRVAEDLGHKWLMFDLSPEYAKIAKRKTAQTGLLGRCGT
jgi:DNA modification methylase